MSERIGINTARPDYPIHMIIDRDEFTDEDIRKWANGNLIGIDFATGQESLIIEYLSQIIVAKVMSV